MNDKNERIIKLSDKELDDINQNLDKINKSKVFQKKITLQQNGSGIFSFLLPILASTIIPSLIKGKGNYFFEKINILNYLKKIILSAIFLYTIY